MSPFRKITQQLGALDLKSPDLEDFATPMGPAPDLWPQMLKSNSKNNSFRAVTTSSMHLKSKSPSATDINTIASIQNSVKTYAQTCRQLKSETPQKRKHVNGTNDVMSFSLPVNLGLSDVTESTSNLRFSETHFDVNGDVMSSIESSETREEGDYEDHKRTPLKLHGETNENGDVCSNQFLESKNEILLNSSEFDENGFVVQNCSIVLGHNGAFLDTKVCDLFLKYISFNHFFFN